MKNYKNFTPMFVIEGIDENDFKRRNVLMAHYYTIWQEYMRLLAHNNMNNDDIVNYLNYIDYTEYGKPEEDGLIFKIEVDTQDLIAFTSDDITIRPKWVEVSEESSNKKED